jgi:hypothetical protein
MIARKTRAAAKGIVRKIVRVIVIRTGKEVSLMVTLGF